MVVFGGSYPAGGLRRGLVLKARVLQTWSWRRNVNAGKSIEAGIVRRTFICDVGNFESIQTDLGC